MNNGCASGTYASEDDVFGDVADGLEQDLPIRFALSSFDRQTVGVGGLVCTMDAEGECDATAAAFTDALDDGGAAIGLTQDEIDQLKAAANAPGPNGTLLNWRCIAQPTSGGR